MRTIITTWVAVIATLFPTIALSALPPTRAAGQSGTLSTTFDFKTPYNQATKYSGTGVLLENDSYDLLKNPRFEATTYNTAWTASGGTVAAAATTNIFFSKGATWDSGSASQTFTSDAITVPEGFKGNNCEASMYIKVPSGTATHLIQAWDGTNILASASVVNSVYFTKNTVTFPCPTSGTIALRLISVAADEPLIALDEGYLGLARNVGVADLTTEVTAYSPTFNATTGHSASNGWWYRDGDRIVIGGSILWNGTGAVSTFTATLPSVCTIDTAKLNDSTAASLRNYYGWWSWYDDSGGLSTNPQRVRVNTTSSILLMDGSNSVLSNIFANNDRITWRAEFPCVGWAASTVVMPDAQGWYVDANITGGNFSLGVADVTAYTEMTNSAMTLTPRSGSAPAGIMCSSTNAAASPSSSATTCSAGSESFGLAVNLPRSGAYEVCGYFGHFAQADQAESLNSSFQWVETPTNAQTNTTLGGTVTQSGITALTIASGTTQANTAPHTNCSIFNWSAGTKGVRLMYEQSIVGTPNNSLVLADELATGGQRNIRVTVKPVSQQQQAVLANSVSTGTTNGEKIGAARFTCSASSTITRQSSGFITAIGNAVDVGAYRTCAFTIASGYFSATPNCTISGNATDPAKNYSWADGSATSGSASGPDEDYGATIHCIGPR